MTLRDSYENWSLNSDDWSHEQLQSIKEEIWAALGVHPDTYPDVVINMILELRHYARQIPD